MFLSVVRVSGQGQWSVVRVRVSGQGRVRVGQLGSVGNQVRHRYVIPSLVSSFRHGISSSSFCRRRFRYTSRGHPARAHVAGSLMLPRTAATNNLGGRGVSGTAATHRELERFFSAREWLLSIAGGVQYAMRFRQTEQSHLRGEQFSCQPIKTAPLVSGPRVELRAACPPASLLRFGRILTSLTRMRAPQAVVARQRAVATGGRFGPALCALRNDVVHRKRQANLNAQPSANWRDCEGLDE